MFKLAAPNAALDHGRRLTASPRSPWVIGTGDEARFVEDLAGSGARWQRITHKVGWFKKFHMLESTPAEMVLVRSFLEEAHRTLAARTLVVGIPANDVIIAADRAEVARVMVIATLRFTQVEDSRKLTPDLFRVEDGVVVGMVINTLLEAELPETAEVTRVLQVGRTAEFHVTAGRDVDSLFDLAEDFVGLLADKWLPDPTFGGDCVLFVTAPETMQSTLDALTSEVDAAIKAAGCAGRLRFRIERVPCSAS